MSTDLLRTQANERIDLADFQYLTTEQSWRSERQSTANFLTNPAGQRAWIIDGFDMTNPAAQQLSVTLGRAILGYRFGSQVIQSMLTTEGDASRILDLGTIPQGAYNIYLRFEFVDGDSASRVFWNPAGDGGELTQTIPTRVKANWSVRVETGSPGSEWFQIGTVDTSGGGFVLVDQRPLYFEGEIHNSYQSGWGTEGGGAANDRSVDRKQYGVKDLQAFTAATRQCIEDLKGRGLRRWWEKGIGGMNVGFDDDPVEDVLAVGDDEFYLHNDGTDGFLNFDTDDYWAYDRSEDEWSWYINSAIEMTLGDTGLMIDGGLHVGYDPGYPYNEDEITLRDSDLGLKYNSGSPVLQWDGTLGASEDGLRYTRGTDLLEFLVGGSKVAEIDSVGTWKSPQIKIVDDNFSIWQSASKPRVTFDANDYLEYVRGSNYLDTYINNNLETRVTANGLEVSDGLVVGLTLAPVADRIILGDAQFYLDKSGANPIINFDASDYLIFDRTNSAYRFYGTGVPMLQLQPMAAASGFILGETGQTYIEGVQSVVRVYSPRLQVYGTVGISEDKIGFAAEIFNDGNNANREGISIVAGADDGTGTTYFLKCADGNGTFMGGVRSDGTGGIDYFDASDETLKQNIRPTGINALAALNTVECSSFEWKKNGLEVPIGFVAQQLEKSDLPWVASEDDTGLKVIRKGALIPVLVRAIQQLTEKVEALSQ